MVYLNEYRHVLTTFVLRLTSFLLDYMFILKPHYLIIIMVGVKIWVILIASTKSFLSSHFISKKWRKMSTKQPLHFLLLFDHFTLSPQNFKQFASSLGILLVKLFLETSRSASADIRRPLKYFYFSIIIMWKKKKKKRVSRYKSIYFIIVFDFLLRFWLENKLFPSYM